MADNLNIKFDDYSEINATREVLEDLLSRQYVKDNLSIYDYKRVKDLAKQLLYNTSIDSDNSFFYRGYKFTLIKVHSPAIVDKVICFYTNNDHDILMSWCYENTDIIEIGKMPPVSLLTAIDNYLDRLGENNR